MDIDTDYTIREFDDRDSTAVIDIFNHFIVNSFAAYAEEPVGYEAITVFKDMTKGYPFFVVETDDGDVPGFSFLRPFHRTDIFRRVGEITYFILPEHTGKGLGKRLLAAVIEGAKKHSIDSILASISSLNKQSLAFHQRNGFFQCGCFESIGKKFNRDFDMVWMQKKI
jgi:L-amino acid N-acyltransferase YncA